MLVGVIAFTTGCNDPEKIKPGDKGNLILEFDNVAGESDFTLNSGIYTNAAGESFQTTKLQYYVSNIKLKDSEGNVTTLPQSYHLVREDNANSQLITLKDLPAADYTEVTFMLGVDSLRNTMEVSQRTGDLDIGGIGADMYWSWNSGYIFFKMEGTSTAILADSTNPDRHFYYHIGGYGGYSSQTINNIKTITLPFSGSKAMVRTKITPQVHIEADILKVFTGAKTIKLADAPTIMFSAKSLDIANNYKDMFEVHHVHNDH